MKKEWINIEVHSVLDGEISEYTTKATINKNQIESVEEWISGQPYSQNFNKINVQINMVSGTKFMVQGSALVKNFWEALDPEGKTEEL